MRPAFHLSVDVHKYLRTALAATASLCIGAFAGSPTAVAQTVAPIVLPYTMLAPFAGTVGSAATTTSSAAAIGNGGLATKAELSAAIRALAVDGQGNVYIADTKLNQIRKVNAATGVITVVAGGGSTQSLPAGTTVVGCTTQIDTIGDGCLATLAVLNTPRGIALDKAGNLYIAGYNDYLIHRVDAQTGMMTLAAGVSAGVHSSGSTGFSPDLLAPTATKLYSPRGVRVDNFGNIWICDTGDDVVLMINANGPNAGKVTTVAGYNPGTGAVTTTTAASTALTIGDGSLANSSSVLLNTPSDVVFDSANNAYIADFNDHIVRKVAWNPSANSGYGGVGNITTVVGKFYFTSTAGVVPPATSPFTAGVPLAANSVYLGNPTKLAIDASDNLYIADSGESIVYYYDHVAQTLIPVAGEYGYLNTSSTGTYAVCSTDTTGIGTGCPATQSLFSQGADAIGIAVDSQNNLYISDPNNAVVRKVSSGLSFPPAYPPSPVTATTASSQTVEVHLTPGDTLSNAAIASTLGDFTLSGTPSCATSSVDNTTNCTLTVNYTPLAPGVRTGALNITSAKSYQTFPLSAVAYEPLQSFDPGYTSLLGSGLSSQRGLAYDGSGNLYIADTGNHRVLKINATTQAQTVVAGTGSSGYTGDGALATSAKLSGPTAVVVGPDGTVYIADTGNNVVRAINPKTLFISTYAGNNSTTTLSAACTSSYAIDTLGDGCTANQAILNAPSGLTIIPDGDLFIADTGNNAIRRVDANTGAINYFAGALTAETCTGLDTFGDGCPLVSAATLFSAPKGLASDANQNIYVADTGHNLIRKLSSATGLVTVAAGSGLASFGGDNGLATQANLNAPTGVAVDAAGNLYIADSGNSAVRVVNSSNSYISTLLGIGTSAGSSGGTGVASQLLFTNPTAVALDASGDLIVSDTGNSRVIADDRNTGLLAYGLGNTSTYPSNASQPQTATVTNVGNVSLNFTASPFDVFTNGSANSTGQFIAATPTSGTPCATGALSIGASCVFAEEFAPSANGVFSDLVTIPSNAINTASAYMNLTGTGKALISTNITVTMSAASGGTTLEYGESATFTATPVPASGTGTPTGTVSFTVAITSASGTNTISFPAVALSGGQASVVLTQAQLNVGSVTVTAAYSGDTTYAPSNSSKTIPVTLATTTTTLTVTPTPNTYIWGQAQVFTANVVAYTPTAGIPNGTINFVVTMTSGSSAGTVQTFTVGLTGGTAVYNACSGSLTYSTVVTTANPNAVTCSLTPGAYTVQAVYVVPTTGTDNYSTSSSAAIPETINVIPAGMVICPATAPCNYPGNTYTATSNAISIPQGGAATEVLTITPMGGLTGNVTLNCAGLPSSTNCTFYPTVLNLGGSANTVPICAPSASATAYATATPVCTTLTITTNVPPAALIAKVSNTRGGLIAVAAMLPVLLFGGLFSGRKKRLPWMMVVAIFMLAGMVMLPGCVSNVTQDAAGVTPTGTSTVTVTLTGANGATQSIPISLTIVQATAITAEVNQQMALPTLAAMRVGLPSARFGF